MIDLKKPTDLVDTAIWKLYGIECPLRDFLYVQVSSGFKFEKHKDT